MKSLLILFYLFIYGCALTPNAVLYQITTMQRTILYSWKSGDSEREPLSYEKWLRLIGYIPKVKAQTKSKIDERYVRTDMPL